MEQHIEHQHHTNVKE